MDNKHIVGAVKNVGANQGFTGISVLYGSIDVAFSDFLEVARPCPTVTTAWRPTRDELDRLSAGEVIVISLLSEKWPPCAISVKSIDEIH